MKHYLALAMILVGGFMFVVACLLLVTRPALSAAGPIGAILVWRGLLLRHPPVPPSRRKPELSGGNWTHRSGTAKPSFLNKPKDKPADPT
jgi:hypothetical protein